MRICAMPAYFIASSTMAGSENQFSVGLTGTGTDVELVNCI